MAAPGTATEIRDVNTRYHDAAADEYDHKWGIDFHGIGRQQVLGKVTKLLGSQPGPFDRGLEIGAGTGYFAINLLTAGVLDEATCTDISPGMLTTLERNAEQAGVGERVQTQACDAEDLPFADESFDLVFGHAVLHHIPDLAQAFKEFNRVLRPGGTLFFAGEPSREGDKIAVYPKRGAMKAAPLWRRLMGARPAPHVEHPEVCRNGGHELEGMVDVHTFVPNDLRHYATAGGFEDIRVRGEELLANWFGWANRTLESTAEPDTVPWLWRQYAYRGYLALQAVDRAVLEPHLPPAVFYNLMLAARKP
jgi:ubiquinone/menaquinone biosynthesis C-methylase UbiE